MWLTTRIVWPAFETTCFFGWPTNVVSGNTQRTNQDDWRDHPWKIPLHSICWTHSARKNTHGFITISWLFKVALSFVGDLKTLEMQCNLSHLQTSGAHVTSSKTNQLYRIPNISTCFKNYFFSVERKWHWLQAPSCRDSTRVESPNATEKTFRSCQWLLQRIPL